MSTVETLEVVRFTTNWNNKLGCKAFTTLRRWNPQRFVTGSAYRIDLNKADRGVAFLLTERKLRIGDLNEFIARIDTGYSLAQCRAILMKMYRDEWMRQGNNMELGLYLFTWADQKQEGLGL